MAVVWNASLPQLFSADRHRRRRPENVVRTRTASGRMRARLIGKKYQELWDVAWVMTDAEVAIFDVWYRDSISSGEAPFQGLNHPLGTPPPGGVGANRVWQFNTDPEDDLWQGSPVNRLVTAQLWLLPDLPT